MSFVGPIVGPNLGAVMSGKIIKQDREISVLAVDEGKSVKRFSVQSRHGGGLHIEVRSNGKKRFVYRFRLADKQHDLVIGYYPRVTLAEARAAHKEATALVRQGIDPRQVAQETKLANLEMPTLAACYRDWLAMRSKSQKPIGPRTLSDYEGTFTRHIERALGNKRVCDISRASLYEHFRHVGSTEGTRKGLILLNQCLDHAVLQGHIELNPARLLKPAMFGASMGKPRKRWLNRDELSQLWAALEQATSGGGSVAAGGRGIASNVVLSPTVANCLRLITLTAVRRSEAAQMRFDQINGDRWTIPKTKNGHAHVVTLSPLALEIIEKQRALSGGPFVFGSASKAGHPITGDSLTKALERVRNKHLAELEPFCVHDLRRSVASGAAEYLDAPERLIELMLNHLPRDRLIRTYQAGGMSEKLRGLFLRWGCFMQGVIQPEQAVPDNVVPIAASK